jgi:GxxExxY protein
MTTSYSPLPEATEKLGAEIVDAGLTVHRLLGPGFKEQIYRAALGLELEQRRIPYESEKIVSVRYREWDIPGQRIDLVVGGVIIVEVKAASRLKEIHRRQLFSCLRTTHLRLGYVMNFNTVWFRDGLKRVVV